jgi:hypothetical protein
MIHIRRIRGRRARAACQAGCLLLCLSLLALWPAAAWCCGRECGAKAKPGATGAIVWAAPLPSCCRVESPLSVGEEVAAGREATRLSLSPGDSHFAAPAQ